MACSETSDAFLLLDQRDNVLVCIRTLPKGAAIAIDGVNHVLPQPIELGHKIARRPLAEGDVVHRFGVPIGAMTMPAAPADHVHLHNLKSLYIPAHVRGAMHQAEPAR